MVNEPDIKSVSAEAFGILEFVSRM